MTVQDAVKVLLWKGFGCAIMDDGSVFITLHQATDDPLFTQGGSAYDPEETVSKAITLLANDDAVMERVENWLRNRHELQNCNGDDRVETLNYAISLRMTLSDMGVE